MRKITSGIVLVLILLFPPAALHAACSNWGTLIWGTDVWGGSCTSSTSSSTLTITKSEIGGVGTVSSGDSGINCGASCSHTYTNGSVITLTAAAEPYLNTTSVFAGWSGGGCSGTGTCSITLNSDTTVTVKFISSLPSPDSSYGLGAVAMKVNTLKGSEQEIIAVPPVNLSFTELKAVSTPDTSGAMQLWTGNSINSATITLSFSVSGAQPGVMNDVTFYLPQGSNVNTVMKYGHKTDLSTSEWYNFTCGTRARPCGEASNDSEHGKRKVVLHLEDGKTGDNDLTVNGVIDDPVTFAYFDSPETENPNTNPDVSEVITKSGNGGTISPAGITSYNMGQMVPVTIIPEQGFHIADVKINGKSIGAVHDYTLKTSSTTHIIQAAFEMGDIQINGSNKAITVKSGGPLTVNVSLNNRGNSQAGDMDWWCAANTPFGWYRYDAASGQWKEGLAVSYRGPLFNLAPFDVLKIAGLPAGKYTFYFGISKNVNRAMEYNSTFTYDSVEVTVEAGQREAASSAPFSSLPARRPAPASLAR